MINKFMRYILLFFNKAASAVRKLTISVYKKAFYSCGANVKIGKNCSFARIENIIVGDDVSFGKNMLVMTTRAKVIIKSHVMFAPGVAIVSGNHRIDMVGEYICHQ